MLRTDRAVVPTMMKGGTVSLRRARATPSNRERRPARPRRAHRARSDRPRAGLDPDHSRSSPRALRGVRTERQPTSSDLHRRHDHPAARDACEPDVVGRVAGLPRDARDGRRRRRTGSARRPSCPTRRSTTCASSWPASARRWDGKQAPDLQEWVDRSRLNLMSGLGDNDDQRNRPRAAGPFLRGAVSRTREAAGVRGTGHATGTSANVRTSAARAHIVRRDPTKLTKQTRGS